VINMSDAIGGVQVCLSDPIKDDHTGINWPAGERTLGVPGFASTPSD
jgi:anionic cell wall polymer biosynthesis LytR-Cps2A-Psr (LCP) family protein